MLLISWNVNGLRACAGKGFADFFLQADADFFCLQETKVQAGQIDLAFPGYESYWNYAEKKGYSGTAIYTRHKPIGVHYGMGTVRDDGGIEYDNDSPHNHEGRMITLEYDGFYLLTAYVPNSQDGLKRLDYRMQWEDDFLRYVSALDRKKPVIFCGDLNVAHQEIDLKNPKTNTRNPGFTIEEREKFSQLLSRGFKDTFRTLHPEDPTYSWWSYRFRAREKNIGWRIDYFVVSERIMPKVTEANIHTEVPGSDHCPVALRIEM